MFLNEGQIQFRAYTIGVICVDGAPSINFSNLGPKLLKLGPCYPLTEIVRKIRFLVNFLTVWVKMHKMKIEVFKNVKIKVGVLEK